MVSCVDDQLIQSAMLASHKPTRVDGVLGEHSSFNGLDWGSGSNLSLSWPLDAIPARPSDSIVSSTARRSTQ